MAFDTSILPQYLASAVRYVYDAVGDSPKIYFDEFPEQIQCPGIYFPVPRQDGKQVTLNGTHQIKINFEAWFIGASDYDAFSLAGTVQKQILIDDRRIPIIKEDGTITDRKFSVTEPVIRKREERIVRLTFTIDEYFGRNEVKAAAKTFEIFGLIPATTKEGA